MIPNNIAPIGFRIGAPPINSKQDPTPMRIWIIMDIITALNKMVRTRLIKNKKMNTISRGPMNHFNALLF